MWSVVIGSKWHANWWTPCQFMRGSPMKPGPTTPSREWRMARGESIRWSMISTKVAIIFGKGQVDKMSWPHTNSLCWLFIIPMGSSINTFIRNYHQSTYILGLCEEPKPLLNPSLTKTMDFLLFVNLRGYFLQIYFVFWFLQYCLR